MNTDRIVIAADDAALLRPLAIGEGERTEVRASAESLSRVLRRARIVAPHVRPPSVVHLDAVVDYTELASGRGRRLVLRRPDRAEPMMGDVSVASPLGRALIGRSVGAVVELPTQGDRTAAIRIDAVRRAD